MKSIAFMGVYSVKLALFSINFNRVGPKGSKRIVLIFFYIKNFYPNRIFSFPWDWNGFAIQVCMPDPGGAILVPYRPDISESGIAGQRNGRGCRDLYLCIVFGRKTYAEFTSVRAGNFSHLTMEHWRDKEKDQKNKE